MQHENNTTKVKARLEREGWTNQGGKEHDKFTKPGHDPILVPRHRKLSPGVARTIAKGAGW